MMTDNGDDKNLICLQKLKENGGHTFFLTDEDASEEDDEQLPDGLYDDAIDVMS